MGNILEIGKVGEIEDGTMKEVVVSGHAILLARVGDDYYATENNCPHMGAKLSEGRLEGTVVTCPRHGSQFSLEDGSFVRWLKGAGIIAKIGKVLKSPRSLTAYNLKFEADKILIEL